VVSTFALECRKREIECPIEVVKKVQIGGEIGIFIE
jgi:hypothetical protein